MGNVEEALRDLISNSKGKEVWNDKRRTRQLKVKILRSIICPMLVLSLSSFLLTGCNQAYEKPDNTDHRSTPERHVVHLNRLKQDRTVQVMTGRITKDEEVVYFVKKDASNDLRMLMYGGMIRGEHPGLLAARNITSDLELEDRAFLENGKIERTRPAIEKMKNAYGKLNKTKKKKSRKRIKKLTENRSFFVKRVSYTEHRDALFVLAPDADDELKLLVYAPDQEHGLRLLSVRNLFYDLQIKDGYFGFSNDDKSKPTAPDPTCRFTNVENKNNRDATNNLSSFQKAANNGNRNDLVYLISDINEEHVLVYTLQDSGRLVLVAGRSMKFDKKLNNYSATGTKKEGTYPPIEKIESLIREQ